MAIIDVPAGMTFSKVNSFTLQRASNVLRSKYTGQGQRIVYPFAVWMLEATLNETDGALAGRIRSFLAQLEGQKNSFRLPVPGYYRPLLGWNFNGETNGDNGALARSSSLRAILPGHLSEGDYFTIGDELKIATAAVAAGAPAVISFKPALRKSYPHATPIIFVRPTVLMTAQEDDVASWGIGPPVRQSGKFNAVEAVDI